eukprot:scaffold99066_cov60-Cyclotella_meneghiniana.AAC.1
MGRSTDMTEDDKCDNTDCPGPAGSQLSERYSSDLPIYHTVEHYKVYPPGGGAVRLGMAIFSLLYPYLTHRGCSTVPYLTSDL